MIKNKKCFWILCLGFLVISALIISASLSNGITAETTISPNPAYYIVGNENSTIAYKKAEKVNDVFGAIASVSAGDKIVMRQVIDLKEFDRDTQFIKVRPDTIGGAEFGILRIKIIDVYDEENYITVQVKPHQGLLNSEPYSYTLTAASNGQKMTGYHHGTKYLEVEVYGTDTMFAFYEGENNWFGLSFDYYENRIFKSDAKMKGNLLVADYDDSFYFGSNLWSGFTTGEVYCEIYCDDFQQSQAKLIIEKYGKYDLSENVIDDVDGPIITVDFGEYDENTYPNALVGKQYGVFNATAFDIYSGNADVAVQVYLDYYSDNKVLFSLKNGSFVPSVEGLYSIVYKAQDGRGNIAEKVVDVTAFNQADFGTFGIECDTEITNSIIGDEVLIPAPTYTNNLGNVKCDIVAKLGDKTLQITDGRVRPESIGTLNITYYATDYVLQKAVKTITIQIVETNKPTFIEHPTLPECFIDGNEYYLPKVDAYNYVNATGDIIPVKIIEINGIKRTEITGKYIPSVSDSGDVVTIKYVASINGVENSLIYNVKVYKVREGKNVDMARYFVSESGSAVANSDSVLLTTSTNQVFTFINYVRSTKLQLDFLTTETTSKIGKITFIVRDFYDSNNSIKLNYLEIDKKGYFYLNDDKNAKVLTSNTFAKGNNFSFVYDNIDRTFKYSSLKNDSIKVLKNASGKDFNGFKNNLFYVDIALENVTGTSSVAITKLNKNFFSNEKQDYVAPNIDVIGEYGGDFALNTVFTIPKVLVYDVLDGDVDAYLTVTKPDGSVMNTVSGKKLNEVIVDDSENELSLTDYGTYFVTYNAKDSYGNKLNFSYSVRVIDDEEPTITLKNKIASSVKLGEKVYIPSAEVKDNKDVNLKYAVYVFAPNGHPYTFDLTTAGFIVNAAGSYKVIYTATDSEGNVGIRIFTINVE